MRINEITEMQGTKPAIIKNLKPGTSAEIDHGDGLITRYAHCKKVTMTKKQQPGQKPNPATQAKRGDKVVVAPQ